MTAISQAEGALLGATTIQGVEASAAASGGSAACAATSGETAAGAIASENTAACATTSGGSAASAATSGDITLDATVSKGSVVVYAAQIHYKAIPIVESATDRGISSGTERSESADLGVPAARADTRR